MLKRFVFIVALMSCLNGFAMETAETDCRVFIAKARYVNAGWVGGYFKVVVAVSKDATAAEAQLMYSDNGKTWNTIKPDSETTKGALYKDYVFMVPTVIVNYGIEVCLKAVVPGFNTDDPVCLNYQNNWRYFHNTCVSDSSPFNR